MDKYTTRSGATQELAAEQTHSDLHPGRGVIIVPSHDAIAIRAYEIYVKSGCRQGRCEQNWLRAEHELQRKHQGRT